MTTFYNIYKEIKPGPCRRRKAGFESVSFFVSAANNFQVFEISPLEAPGAPF
jgi:hypothetical protein